MQASDFSIIISFQIQHNLPKIPNERKPDYFIQGKWN